MKDADTSSPRLETRRGFIGCAGGVVVAADAFAHPSDDLEHIMQELAEESWDLVWVREQ
jgi:hypothetical protein